MAAIAPRTPSATTPSPLEGAAYAQPLLEPPPPLQTNAYRREDLVPLPSTLEDSLAAYEADDTLRAAFDPEFVQAFIALKRHEIEKARAANPGYGGEGWHSEVTEWERGQFLFLA